MHLHEARPQGVRLLPETRLGAGIRPQLSTNGARPFLQHNVYWGLTGRGARAGLRAHGGREPVIRACPRGEDGVGEGGPAELNTWSLHITVGWEGRARCPEGEAFLKQGHETEPEGDKSQTQVGEGAFPAERSRGALGRAELGTPRLESRAGRDGVGGAPGHRMLRAR